MNEPLTQLRLSKYRTEQRNASYFMLTSSGSIVAVCYLLRVAQS